MRLVIVSNRLPFTATIKDGAPNIKPSAGGLTTGLWSYLEQNSSQGTGAIDILWLGWPGANIPVEQQPALIELAEKEFKCHPVFLPESSIEGFYHGFCNKTLWPLFHYFPTLTRYEEQDWQEYKRVNQLFADALVPLLRPDDVVWVHDYQLMLLPRLIRQARPEIPIGFFLHIPFPSYEVFRLLPRAWRLELIEGGAWVQPGGLSYARLYTRFSDQCAANRGSRAPAWEPDFERSGREGGYLSDGY